MPIDALGPDEVLAMRYDVQSFADELAAWCGGQVERAVTEDGVVTATVWVPTGKGPRPAVLGDWVIRRGEEDHAVLDALAFAALHGPA